MPENSCSIAFNFLLTDFSRKACPGIMKVRPTYLFLTNPSLYGRLSVLAICNAAILPESGTGITASISWSGHCSRIRSANLLPWFNLALYTEIPSMTESGLAK